MQQEEVVKALREEREELERELKALDSVIARFERRPSNYVQQENYSSNNPLSTSAKSLELSSGSDANFPKGASLEQQVVYVLGSLKKALRYPELQIEYAKLSGSKRNIRKDLADFRRGGALVAIKYNNNSTQVYQGLPDWVTETESGPIFKPEFIIMNEKNFPTGVWKSAKMDEDPT